MSPDRSWYLPLNHTGHDKNLPPLDSSEMSGIANLFRDRSIRKIGHETKRDWHALKSADIEIDEVSYDLLIASFLAEPGRRSYDVNVLALECLGKEINSRESVVGKGKGEVAFVDVPVSTAAAYSCARTEMVLVLKEYFAERLMDFSLQSLFNDVEMPLTKVLVEMEAAGIGINLDALAELSTSFSAELEKLEKEIYEEAGTEFNINSTPQLRHILFEKLQLPVLKKTKTGPSTDASVLTQLADTGFSLPIILLEYRELTKLRSTYVDALPGAVDTATGRIHTTFNQIGAATGRLSSHDPN
ncbi:MAG: DNA polymerase I, partial [Candidatus Hydrogenedentes bacterium]|nr:DNA polymerase I [Candidatus Hydrogenedentota bacterium]